MTDYIVVCEHSDGREHVANITDRRPAGGVEVEDFLSRGTPVTPRNRLGSRRLIVFACDTCQLTSPPLADTTVAELLDKLAPMREQLLAAEMVPAEVPVVDPDDLADVLTGGRPQWVVVGERRRLVLPLNVLCTLVTGLRDRRRS
ncbi:hypothetical protein [Mycolicibacterium sp.]|uniref:hypothetical protein n=1 Tax=Mycolicibacterium sp. TaxID=2320850 RepID=UPI001DF60973|nr:hypothetical protein [Mycolicibacterium sp.]MCB1290346.1 hypothetical protein [Mycobacterium sp.]MCB9408327.1 hypothetical protein [Mycolicibacterium sp.]